MRGIVRAAVMAVAALAWSPAPAGAAAWAGFGPVAESAREALAPIEARGRAYGGGRSFAGRGASFRAMGQPFRGLRVTRGHTRTMIDPPRGLRGYAGFTPRQDCRRIWVQRYVPREGGWVTKQARTCRTPRV